MAEGNITPPVDDEVVLRELAARTPADWFASCLASIETCAAAYKTRDEAARFAHHVTRKQFGETYDREAVDEAVERGRAARQEREQAVMIELRARWAARIAAEEAAEAERRSRRVPLLAFCARALRRTNGQASARGGRSGGHASRRARSTSSSGDSSGEGSEGPAGRGHDLRSGRSWGMR